MAKAHRTRQAVAELRRCPGRDDILDCTGDAVLTSWNTPEARAGERCRGVEGKPLGRLPECGRLRADPVRRFVTLGRAGVTDEHKLRREVEVEDRGGRVEATKFDLPAQLAAARSRQQRHAIGWCSGCRIDRDRGPTRVVRMKPLAIVAIEFEMS